VKWLGLAHGYVCCMVFILLLLFFFLKISEEFIPAIATNCLAGIHEFHG
jgi:hypothetical protein